MKRLCKLRAKEGAHHKVLTYMQSTDYRAVSGVFQHIDPPSPPSECILPPYQRRKHLLGGEGGGGSIFWKTPDIGLAFKGTWQRGGFSGVFAEIGSA